MYPLCITLSLHVVTAPAPSAPTPWPHFPFGPGWLQVKCVHQTFGDGCFLMVLDVVEKRCALDRKSVV